MFLSEKQALARLDSEKNLANRFGKKEVKILEEEKPQVILTEKVIPLPGKNRINLTKDERTEIAILSRAGTDTNRELARAFNIEEQTVSLIKNAKTKGINEEKVEETINIAKDRALDRLMASLNLLTNDKLSGCNAKDLSVIASNMGRVVEKIQTRTEAPDNINFIIYSPELKQERAYETVEI